MRTNLARLELKLIIVMDNWSITITGAGNRDDADLAALECVALLLAQGQVVSHATITSGEQNELLNDAPELLGDGE
jgi:hypothetical protein